MIDLQLAKNYVPGCVCVGKVALLCITRTALNALGVKNFNIYVLLTVFLFFDRKLYREYIFNTNTLACFVLFAIIFDEARITYEAVDEGKQVAGFVLNVMWVLVSVLALYHSQYPIAAMHYVLLQPLVLSGFFMFLHSFVLCYNETSIWLYLRIANFVLLSVFWTYFVDIFHIATTEVRDCSDCILYFGTVLFTYIPIAIISTLWLMGCLIWASRRIHYAKFKNVHSETESDADTVTLDVELDYPTDTADMREVCKNYAKTQGNGVDNAVDRHIEHRPDAREVPQSQRSDKLREDEETQLMFAQAKVAHMRQRI
jgi:hypothetical protein